MILQTYEFIQKLRRRNITVIGGLAATTFMTLFVIPIIYSLFERVSFKEKPAEK